MKRFWVFAASISATLFFLMTPFLSALWSIPRMGGGSGGWGAGSSYMKMYDPSKVETIKGEITSIDKITPSKGMSHGIHLTVKTDKETISVHLGPAWYIDNQDVTLDVGQTIEVTGSRITYDGKPALIVRELKMGGQVLILRDDKGYPAWSGWRRR